MEEYLMKGGIICICLIIFSLHLSIQAHGVIYSWVDDHGKRHFSDKPSHDKQSQLFELDELTTTVFVKSKTTYSQQKLRRKSRSGRTKSGDKSGDKKERGCNSIGKTIARLEQKLSSKLAPDKFDRYKQELNQLRWNKIKYC